MFKSCRKKFSIIPNVFTSNILVKSLDTKNDIDRDIKVLEEMSAMRFIPNVITYTTILGGC